MEYISVLPAAPNSGTPITIVAEWSGCLIEPGYFTRAGSTYDIYFNYHNTCFATPPAGPQNFEIGALPVGLYNIVEHILIEGEPIAPPETLTASFIVADLTAIPTAPATDAMSSIAICILVFAIASRSLRSRR